MIPDMITTSMELTKYKGPHQKLVSSLIVIDANLTGFIRKIVKSTVNNPDDYYIKTGIYNGCYMVFLYSSERNAVAGYSWTVADIVEKCSAYTIEMELNTKIRKMILRFEDSEISTKEVNWVD